MAETEQTAQTETAKKPIQFGEPVDGKYHCEAVVLSGAVLHNKELGQFKIDLNTLVYHKERLTADYDHDPDNVLGYAENFRVTESGLTADVYLVEKVKKVQDIIELVKAGTPFEMSPSINEKEGILETEDGTNIYKNVPMRGVAVCPFGTDRFTTLTLLKEETMAKKTTTVTTNLSEEKPAEENKEKKVTNQELNEFIEIFGKDRGIDLYQEGVSIEDVRKWKELKDKFDIPDPAPETTALSEEEKEKPSETPPAEPPKKDENTNLNAVVTELKKTITGLTGEITKLKAAVPRGESTPVSVSQESTKPENSKKMSNIDKLTNMYQKMGEKKNG